MRFFTKQNESGIPMLRIIPVLVGITVVTIQIQALEVAIRILGRGHQVRSITDIVEHMVVGVEVTWSWRSILYVPDPKTRKRKLVYSACRVHPR